MLRKVCLLVLLAILVPVLAIAGIHQNPKTTLRSLPAITGNEAGPAVIATPVYPSVPSLDEVDVIGDTFTIGNTWYENQHNGTCGRMNTLEADGWRQFTWMKGDESGAINRHIWWNGIDPNNVQVFPGTGVAVESSLRGGFVNMDLGSNGAAFPCYHNTTAQSPSLPVTATSMDLIPHSGAFLDFQAPAAPVAQVIWPRMQISNDQRLHIAATNQVAAAGNPQRMWYISATYDAPGLTMTYDPQWSEVDWTMTIAIDEATSPVAGSNKCLWAWTRSRQFTPQGPSNPDSTYTQLDNDIYYLIDDDGLNPNFRQGKINLTNFIPPDPSLLPDTLAADKDTLRAYTDLGCFIDHNNYAHIVFTVRSYFSLEGTTYWNASLIFHWSEQFPEQFRVVGSEDYFAFNFNVDCGAWNVKAQRPNLAEDANGNLYCMYQVFDTDTLHLSAAPNYMPSGEIYMSVSTDGGMNWSQGINVTNTITPTEAQPGQCWSEVTPTIAKKADTYCHIQYVLDKDAGNILQTEGSWTDNPTKYHRVPVSLIPTTPLLVQTKFLHIGGTPPGVEPGQNPVAPNTFALKQNYPNPFNPSTTIAFTLDAISNVSVDVFNTRGQIVANVAKGSYGPGEHTVTFNAANLPSGVYFCKLTSGNRTAQQKMVLMK